MFYGTDITTKLAGGDIAFHASHVNHAHQMTSLVTGPLQCSAVDRKCEPSDTTYYYDVVCVMSTAAFCANETILGIKTKSKE